GDQASGSGGTDGGGCVQATPGVGSQVGQEPGGGEGAAAGDGRGRPRKAAWGVGSATGAEPAGTGAVAAGDSRVAEAIAGAAGGLPCRAVQARSGDGGVGRTVWASDRN